MNFLKILVVGANKVGKSSLIHSLVSESEDEDVPSILDEVMIPPENKQDPTVLITDSGNNYKELILYERYDAILAVYDITKPNSLDFLTNNLFTFLKENNQSCQVVIVGNKVDLIDPSQIDEIKLQLKEFSDKMLSIYNNIEASVLCTKFSTENIQTAFYYCERSVLSPLTPIYNRLNNSFTDKYIMVLHRIFNYYDIDCDNYLNDTELSNFQKSCFYVDLLSCHISQIKNILFKANKNALYKNYITFDGFVLLVFMFIERDNPESCWQILHKFNYNKELQYNTSHLPVIDNNCRYELSDNAINYLRKIFIQYDSDHDGKLSYNDIKEMSKITEYDNIFYNENILNSEFFSKDIPFSLITKNVNDTLTYISFFSLWNLLIHINVNYTLEMLIYLGYRDDINTAFVVKKCPSLEFRLHKELDYKTIHCFVVGSKGSGKTSFISHFLQNEITSYPTDTYTGVYSISGKSDEEKSIIMTECSNNNINKILTNNINYCDVVYILYDSTSTQSAYEAINIQKQIPLSLKMQFIGTKSDLLTVKFNECESFKIIRKHTQDVGLIDPLEFNNRIKNFNHNLLYEFTVTRGIGFATKSKRSMKLPVVMTLSTLAVIGLVSFQLMKRKRV